MYFSLKHTLEIPAVIAAFINIFLAARVNIWNWLLGAIAVTLYAIIFYTTHLYANMCLQGVYFAAQIYGFYQWQYGGEKHMPLAVKHFPGKLYAPAVIALLVLFGLFIFILSHYTNSTTPYIDAFTTAIALIAQWMMCKKWLENWILWILLDLSSLHMYWNKHLYLSMCLYASFIILCCFGYRTWKKAIAV